MYDDTSLLCSDGQVTAPRTIVALTFASLYPVLREQQEADSLCLVLPQHSLLEVERLMYRRCTSAFGVILSYNNLTNMH